MQQKIDGGLGVIDSEFRLDDRSNFAATERANPILGTWASVDPLTELFNLQDGQERRSTGPGSVGKTVDPVAVIPDDPLLDRPPGDAEGVGNLDGSLTSQSEHNSPQSQETAFVLRLPGEFFQSVEAEMIDYMHDAALA